MLGIATLLHRAMHSRHAQATQSQTGGLRWLGVPYVRSVTQVSFGRVATNVWATTCSETGRACVESVVVVNRRTY